jgi:polyisoprenoid-binding protein YceI
VRFPQIGLTSAVLVHSCGAGKEGRQAERHPASEGVMFKPLCSVALLAVVVGARATAEPNPEQWVADTARSHITVHVFKSGIFSGLAHDHHFVAGNWRATATFESASPSEARVEILIAADSLRDQQPGLSDQDREKVDRQAAGRDVLDSSHYPQIRFVSKSLEIASGTSAPDGGLQGMLTGTLSLHGQERPVSVPLTATREGSGWRARGAVNFNQSDFGIRPYKGFAGTIAVRDQVTLEYEIVLTPAP